MSKKELSKLRFLKKELSKNEIIYVLRYYRIPFKYENHSEKNLNQFVIFNKNNEELLLYFFGRYSLDNEDWIPALLEEMFGSFLYSSLLATLSSDVVVKNYCFY